MYRLASRITRLVVVSSIVGLGAGHYQAQARTETRQVTRAAHPAEPTAVLVWQGKILPIVTDVYSSFGDLNTALNNRNTDGVATVGDQFASEQQRFETVKPTPRTVSSTSKVMDQGLRNLTNGTKALVVGMRASNNTASQRAATQIVQGLRQFQQAVDQIRRLAGPVSKPTSKAAAGDPVPTPIIRGLP